MKQSEALSAWLDTVGADAALAALADSVPDAAVFAVDRDQNVVLWSAGAEALLGYRADEVLGQHCLKANRCQQCMVGCGIAEHGAVDDVPIVLHRADGSVVRLRKTARALRDRDGAFAGGVEVLVPDRGAAEDAGAVPAGDGEVVTYHGMVSADPAMHRAFETCRNVAQTDASVLVRGDSGTGKELLARAIHAESPRRGGPFVAVNCAALTATLMESELFGHVRGAFTGAVSDRKGIFRQADGGTLFLDEVAELPLDLQAKLLRVLEERAATPVGGSASIPVDVRIVAATHQSLRRRVAAGRFREDLMFRLRVVPIFLPPLRKRRVDIPILLWRFIRERNAAGPRAVDSVAPDAMRALLDHGWPGNVRELRNVVDYAFAVGRGPEIRRDELPPELREPPHAGAAAAAALAEPAEAAAIRAALRATGGHVGKAAERLGISRPTLWRKRKKYGL
ncbi:MAG: PAS domain-containing protein [Deltaproteobacteria bacterium]|nr:MAG: PAS domain-containing protein [Deltaproteobacteria bacterium]